MNRRSIMTLYAESTDPVGHVVRIVLSEKNINVEVQFVTHETKPEDLNDLNPYGTLLTLIDRDLVIYDAQIMLEYLDERYPHPPLMPVDPVARANNRQIRYRIMRDLYGPLGALYDTAEAAAEAARAAIRDNLLAISPAFARANFFLSEEYSLTDCSLAPLLWRLGHYGIRLPAQARPLLKYSESLFMRPGFRSCLSPAEREFRQWH
jgi:RNA polymerase-associated protein